MSLFIFVTFLFGCGVSFRDCGSCAVDDLGFSDVD